MNFLLRQLNTNTIEYIYLNRQTNKNRAYATKKKNNKHELHFSTTIE